MVGPDRLANAVALNSLTFNCARVAGPALAGILIGALGTMPGSTIVFGVNAISFVAVLTGLLRMRTAELHPSRRAARAAGQLRDGLRYVAGNRQILVPILLVGVVGAMGLNFPVTLPLMASEEFDGTARTYGLLTAVQAAGSVVGAGLAARRSGTPRPAALFGGAAAFGALEAGSALMPNIGSFAAVAAPMGAAMLLFTTAANATVQLACEPGVRGRVMAVYVLVFLGTTPIGAPVIGLLSEAAGPRAGLAVGGFACLLAAVVAAVAYGGPRRRDAAPGLRGLRGFRLGSQLHPTSVTPGTVGRFEDLCDD
jgi:MFS family permease